MPSSGRRTSNAAAHRRQQTRDSSGQRIRSHSANCERYCQISANCCRAAKGLLPLSRSGASWRLHQGWPRHVPTIAAELTRPDFPAIADIRLVGTWPRENSCEQRSVLRRVPPLATPLNVIPDARAEVAPSPTPASPAPSLPSIVESPPRAWDQSQEALIARARRVIADEVPRLAAQAQPDVSRVLALAATANYRSQQQAIVDAAYAKWPSESAWIPPTDIEPVRARRLHDEARQTLAYGRVSDAVDIELRHSARIHAIPTLPCTSHSSI